MPLWVPIKGLVDNKDLTADLFNSSLNDVRARTDYLYEQYKSITAGNNSNEAIVLSNVSIIPETDDIYKSRAPFVLDVVAINDVTNNYERADYAIVRDTNGIMEQDKRSLAVGLLLNKSDSGDTGAVAISGKVNLLEFLGSRDISELFQVGEIPSTGPCYLSQSTPGKLTSGSENAIYVGYIVLNDAPYIILNPQYRDQLLRHRHYEFILHDKSAGVSLSWFEKPEDIGVEGKSITKIFGYWPRAYRSKVGDSSWDAYGRLWIKNPDTTTINMFFNTKDPIYEFDSVNLTLTPYNMDSYTLTEKNISSREFSQDADKIIQAGDILINHTQDRSYIIPDVNFPSSIDATDMLLFSHDILSFGKNRLVVSGKWFGAYDSTYTFALRKGNRSSIPESFDDCYVEWTTDNGAIPDGRVRLKGYNIPVSISIISHGVAVNTIYSDSIMQVEDNNTWVNGALKGYTLVNITTGESGIITDNTTTTVTVSGMLKGFTYGDEFKLIGTGDEGLTVVLKNEQRPFTNEYARDVTVADILSTPRVVKDVTYVNNVRTIINTDQNGACFIWDIHLPTDLQGWSPKNWYGVFKRDDDSGVGTDYSFIYYNKDNVDLERVSQIVNIKYPKYFYSIDISDVNLTSGRIFTLNVGSDEYSFMFTTDIDSVSADSNITAILVSTNEDARRIFVNKLKDIGSIEVYSNEDNSCITLTSNSLLDGSSINDAAAIDTSNTVAQPTDTFSDSYVLIHDEFNKVLTSFAIDDQHNGAGIVRFSNYSEIELITNLIIQKIPYNTDEKDTVYSNILYDYKWSAILKDEAPGYPFKYNVSTHPALNKYYPPEPLVSSSIFVDGVLQYSEEVIGSDNRWAIYLSGKSSIYWNTDKNQYIPYSSTYVDQGVDIDFQRLCVYSLAKVNLGGSPVPVLSLRATDPERVKIVECGTDKITSTGDLEIDFNIELNTEVTDIRGHQVVKLAQGNTLFMGPVVEKITTSGGGLVLTDNTGSNGQGVVNISLDNSSVTKGSFNEIMLLNAKQAVSKDIPCIEIVEAPIVNGILAKAKAPLNLVTEVGSEHTLKAYILIEAVLSDSIYATNKETNIKFKYKWSVLPYNTDSDTIITSEGTISDTLDARERIILEIPGDIAITSGDIFTLRIDQYQAIDSEDTTTGCEFKVYDVNWEIL